MVCELAVGTKDVVQGLPVGTAARALPTVSVSGWMLWALGVPGLRPVRPELVVERFANGQALDTCDAVVEPRYWAGRRSDPSRSAPGGTGEVKCSLVELIQGQSLYCRSLQAFFKTVASSVVG
jgi:hypothetical protein